LKVLHKATSIGVVAKANATSTFRNRGVVVSVPFNKRPKISSAVSKVEAVVVDANPSKEVAVVEAAVIPSVVAAEGVAEDEAVKAAVAATKIKNGL